MKRFHNHGYANMKSLNRFSRSCADPGIFHDEEGGGAEK